MDIRSLNQYDLKALQNLVYDLYDEYPLAMKFKERPRLEELQNIFREKMNGIYSQMVIDMVAKEGDEILGECEIVKKSEKTAIVGIIIRKDYRRNGLGTELLNRSMLLAEDMGIEKLVAEVDAKNRLADKFFTRSGFSVKSRRKKKGSELLLVFERKLFSG
jgi:ribosomal protein S18 acetylase RimI-like enzyme